MSGYVRQSFATLVAGKHLLSCMRELVSFTISCRRESFATLVADKHHLSCMGELVCFDITCLRKCFVTLSTDKQFLSCMGESVSFEPCICRLSCKAFLYPVGGALAEQTAALFRGAL